MGDIAERVESSLARLQDARAIANGLKHDPKLHQMAMNAVFVIEDCYEALLMVWNEDRQSRRGTK